MPEPEAEPSAEYRSYEELLDALWNDLGDDAAARELEEMAQETNRWGELLTTANDWLAQTTDSTRRAQLCRRLAYWYEALGHPEYAAAYVQLIASSRVA